MPRANSGSAKASVSRPTRPPRRTRASASCAGSGPVGRPPRRCQRQQPARRCRCGLGLDLGQQQLALAMRQRHSDDKPHRAAASGPSSRTSGAWRDRPAGPRAPAECVPASNASASRSRSTMVWYSGMGSGAGVCAMASPPPRRQQEPVEAVGRQRQQVGELADRRKHRAAISSTGTRPANSDRSSSTACGVRDRLATHRIVCVPRTRADRPAPCGSSDTASGSVPRPNA